MESCLAGGISSGASWNILFSKIYRIVKSTCIILCKKRIFFKKKFNQISHIISYLISHRLKCLCLKNHVKRFKNANLHYFKGRKLKPDIKSALDSSLLRSQQDSSPPHLNESLLVPLTDSTKARDLSSNDSKVTSRRRSHSPGSQTTESRIDPATYVISKKR